MARIFSTHAQLVQRRTTFVLTMNFHWPLIGSDIMSSNIGQPVAVACHNLLFDQSYCMPYMCPDDRGTSILEARTTLISSSVRRTST
ncbi:hypothetical protein SLA2020_226640 [Shorea laevis]